MEEINHDSVAQLKDLMGEKFPGLVETYLKSGREHIENIQKGLAVGDAQMIVDSAHPMKSSAGNMGLKALSASAAELEDRAKEGGDVAPLKALIETLAAQFERGEAFLKENS